LDVGLYYSYFCAQDVHAHIETNEGQFLWC